MYDLTDYIFNHEEKLVYLATLISISFMLIFLVFLKVHAQHQLKSIENLIVKSIILKDCLNINLLKQSKEYNVNPSSVIHFRALYRDNSDLNQNRINCRSLVKKKRRYTI